MKTSRVWAIVLAGLSACGGASSTETETGPIAGRWALQSINGTALPTEVDLMAAGVRVNGTVRSMTLVVDAQNGYVVSSSVTERGVYGSPDPGSGQDTGTVVRDGGNILFHGRFGALAGALRGGTLHEYYKSFDYAYVPDPVNSDDLIGTYDLVSANGSALPYRSSGRVLTQGDFTITAGGWFARNHYYFQISPSANQTSSSGGKIQRRGDSLFVEPYSFTGYTFHGLVSGSTLRVPAGSGALQEPTSYDYAKR
jgi:hypothetical protein